MHIGINLEPHNCVLVHLHQFELAMPQLAIGKCLDFENIRSFEDRVYLIKLGNE